MAEEMSKPLAQRPQKPLTPSGLVGSTPTSSAPHTERNRLVKSETSEIVLQFLAEQQRMICALCRNDLLLIESILSGPDVQERLISSAATVRATLYSVDALGDKILETVALTRHR